MKYIKELLILNIIMLCFSLAASGGFHYVSYLFDENENTLDYEKILDKVRDSDDKEWLRKGTIMSINDRKAAHASESEMYEKFAGSMFLFSLFALVNIYFLYKLRANTISNKSLNSDAQKSRAS